MKFDGVIICTDLDGTLFNSSGTVSERNCEAVRYFQENGGLFTVATGRDYTHVQKYRSLFIPNTYMILINGAYVYDGTDVLYERYLDDGAYDVMNRFAQDDGLSEIYINSKDNVSLCYRKEASFTSLKDKISIPAMKFVACCRNERYSEYLRDALPSDRYSVVRAWPTGTELLHKEANKGSCVNVLRKNLNLKKIVGVGDYENDIPLLKAVDIGVAVDNAPDRVKESADMVTVSNDEDAIAEIIRQLDNGII